MTIRRPILLSAVLAILLFLPLAPHAQEASEDAWPLPAPDLPPGSITNDEKQVMNLALESLNMTWNDLSYRKDYVDDPFRLSVVQRALDDPGSVPEWTYAWDAFLMQSKNPSEIIARATYDLDCSPSVSLPEVDTHTPPDRVLSSFGELPAELSKIIPPLDEAVYEAELRMEVALNSLTPSDREYLRWYLVCPFSDGDDPDTCPKEDDSFEPPQQFLDAMQKFDLSTAIATSRALAGEVDRVVEELLTKNVGYSQKPLVMQGKSGTILIGTKTDDVWYMDNHSRISIIIDPGGNDVYYGSVSSGGNVLDEENATVSVGIDLAGNDMYISNGKRSIGSGLMGIAHHVDVAGDDTYRVGNFGLGCGMFGVGIFEDRAGSDLYDGGSMVEGAAAVGLGLSIDSKGNDSYRAAEYSQGMGFTRGWGMLSDRDGFDTYWAGGVVRDYPRYPGNLSLSQGFAMGMRSVASGGVGILHERNGNDFYSAEVYGQGASYWYGLGVLIDDNGFDWYQCHQYCQGAGIHLSAGMLLDRGGIDRYDAYACTQGYGHDLAVGWLIDENGDDYYTGLGTAHGTGSANGLGIFIDGGGSDGYFDKDPPQCTGWGGARRGYTSLGIFIDMGGKDQYTEGITGNGKWWTRGGVGVGVDVGDDWWKIVKDDQGNEISRTLQIPGVSDD